MSPFLRCPPPAMVHFVVVAHIPSCRRYMLHFPVYPLLYSMYASHSPVAISSRAVAEKLSAVVEHSFTTVVRLELATRCSCRSR